jgi:hypothetical protein
MEDQLRAKFLNGPAGLGSKARLLWAIPTYIEEYSKKDTAFNHHMNLNLCKQSLIHVESNSVFFHFVETCRGERSRDFSGATISII